MRTKITAEEKALRMRNRGKVFLVYGSRCAICGRGGATDIHEVFVTRGMYPAKPGSITDPRNCVPVHSGECHKIAQYTTDGKRRCRDIILRHFSIEDVQAFVESLHMKNPPRLEDLQ